MAIEIVDFPSYKMVDLSIAMLVHQRVAIGDFPKSYVEFPEGNVIQWAEKDQVLALSNSQNFETGYAMIFPSAPKVMQYIHIYIYIYIYIYV